MENDGINNPQPQPEPNNNPAVWDLVMGDMAERDKIGTVKYGTRLQPNNGRDFLVDAYQESLDLAVYLRGEIEERKDKGPHMQINEYLLHYGLFNDEFFSDASTYDIESKMLEEMQELHSEIVFTCDMKNKISECIDVMNMSIKLLTAYGVKDPLHAGYMKLQETARKYREANNASMSHL